MNAKDGEPIEEVVAEATLGHPVLEIAIGGGDEPHVRLQSGRTSHALVLLLLQDAQELHLHGRGELADLVEEEGAGGGELEATALEPVRAGEGAALVAEELGLDERLRQGRAVDGHERTVRPRAPVVDGVGQHLLARAALAREEHLPESIRQGSAGPAPAGAMREQLAGIEQKAIQEALEAEHGNQTRAAKRLGISRRALLYKLEKYGLKG